jgi:hypothetical protein
LSYLNLRKSGDNTTTGVAKADNQLAQIKKLYLPVIKRIKVLKLFWKYISWHDLFSRMIQLIRLVRRTESFVTSPDLSKNYIYFPLHKQPEASTSPMGGVFAYQDLAINILLENLPYDTLVYIKPHVLKGNLAKFLARIRCDPRVILVDSKVNSFQLMKNSYAVATVTGTVGWEAFLNEKTVLMFGDYFYQDAPNVYKIDDADDVVKALKQAQPTSGQEVTSTDKIMAFLMALQNSTFVGWVDNRYAKNSRRTPQNNVQDLSREYTKKIKAAFTIT